MMTVREAARVLHTEYDGEDRHFLSVSTDSRTLKRGDLFMALSGKNYDGCQFISDAEEKGAVAAVIAQGGLRAYEFKPHIPLIQIQNPLLGLGQLAAYWRERFSMPVIGVTGSNGKTTVKEMIASICRYATVNGPTDNWSEGSESVVLATEGNLNNEIGVPQMLLRLKNTHRYAVIEMGMNHVGEIAYLSKMTKPHVAVITNAGAAHIEGLGSVEAVANAKGEIFGGLEQDGVAIINADDAHASLWRKLAGNKRFIDFGLGKHAQVSAEYCPDSFGSRVMMKLADQREVDIMLQVPGLHNVRNALAASAAAIGLGIEKEKIVAGLESFSGVPGRMQRKIGLNQAALIDDTYNANPESVRAALNTLVTMPGRKFLVLGDMGELGEQAIDLHHSIGREAHLAKLDGIFTLGELSECAAKAFGKGAKHFTDIGDLVAELESMLAPDAIFLIKGSRFMQMERIVKQLTIGSQSLEKPI